MRYSDGLTREQFEAVIVDGERFFQSWTGAWYGLDDSWTGPRAAGGAEMVDDRLLYASLGHGDPTGTGPLVEVAVTDGDPLEVAEALDRTPRAHRPGGRPEQPAGTRTTLSVEGVDVAALRLPTGVGWTAVARVAGVCVVVATRAVEPGDVRLVRVDPEPYLLARREHLLRCYDAG